MLTAPHSGSEAVWHRSTVTHRYWELEETARQQRSDDPFARRGARQPVSDITSEAPFVVSDGSGEIVVAPAGADVDAPERVLDRFEPQARGSAPPASSPTCSATTPTAGRSVPLSGVDRPPGARLYVHGVVSDRTGRRRSPTTAASSSPARSEEEIVGQAESVARWTAIGGGVARAGRRTADRRRARLWAWPCTRWIAGECTGRLRRHAAGAAYGRRVRPAGGPAEAGGARQNPPFAGTCPSAGHLQTARTASGWCARSTRAR